MKKITAALAIIFGVPLLVAIPVGAVLALGVAAKWILVQLFAMKPEALQVWLPALATLIAGGIGVLVTKRLERRYDQELRQREVRSRIYEPVMQTLLEMIPCAQEQGLSVVPERFHDRLTEAGRLLLMGGSDGVISAFAKLRGFDYQGGTIVALSEQVAQLILLMRNDLGHQVSSVGKGTLLKLMQVEGAPVEAEPAPVTKRYAGLSINVQK